MVYKTALHTPVKLVSWGEALGKALVSKNCFGITLALVGPMGAGKTSFVRGLAQGIGLKDTVQSPTFSYLHIYKNGPIPLYHFDLYRIAQEEDFFALGFEQYLEASGITVIEWPEIIYPYLPLKTLLCTFSHAQKGRKVEVSSPFDPDLISSLFYGTTT